MTHSNIVSALNSTVSSLLSISTFNSTIGSYLKTADFNNTRTSLVDTSSQQTITNTKTFTQPVRARVGGGSIEVYPRLGQVGESSIHFYRYSDSVSPSLGDIWHVGQSLYTDTVYGSLLDRCFVIGAYGASVFTPRLYLYNRLGVLLCLIQVHYTLPKLIPLR